MEAKSEFPKSLQDAIRYFDDPDVCVEFLASVRWPDGVTCPACEQKRAMFLNFAESGSARSVAVSSP